MKLRISGAQIPVTDNIDQNFQAINRAIDFAISEKAEILLTPEGSLSGYNNKFNQIEVEAALKEITGRARSNGLGLALGTCYFEKSNFCYNQIRFYDTDGSYLGFHSKILTCGTLEDLPKGEIEYFAVKVLEVFKFKGITIGGLICNDLWANPECTSMQDPHLTHNYPEWEPKLYFMQ